MLSSELIFGGFEKLSLLPRQSNRAGAPLATIARRHFFRCLMQVMRTSLLTASEACFANYSDNAAEARRGAGEDSRLRRPVWHRKNRHMLHCARYRTRFHGRKQFARSVDFRATWWHLFTSRGSSGRERK